MTSIPKCTHINIATPNTNTCRNDYVYRLAIEQAFEIDYEVRGPSKFGISAVEINYPYLIILQNFY